MSPRSKYPDTAAGWRLDHAGAVAVRSVAVMRLEPVPRPRPRPRPVLHPAPALSVRPERGNK